MARSGAAAQRQRIDSSVSDAKALFAVSNYLQPEDAPPLGATLLDLGVGDTIGLAKLSGLKQIADGLTGKRKRVSGPGRIIGHRD